jgi:hypothetical protein
VSISDDLNEIDAILAEEYGVSGPAFTLASMTLERLSHGDMGRKILPAEVRTAAIELAAERGASQDDTEAAIRVLMRMYLQAAGCVQCGI